MSWHIPSRGRPARCQALLDAMTDHGCIERGFVWCNDDDPDLPEYLALHLPPGWELRFVPPGVVGLCEKLRQAFTEFRDDPWFGVIADDMTVETPGFEAALVAAAGAWGIASSNDRWKAREDVAVGRMTGACVFGGEFLRALGYWVPEGFQHLYSDDVLETIGRRLGNWRCLMDVVAAHPSDPYLQEGAMDATCAAVNTEAAYAAGKARYTEWLAGEAENDIDRVRAALWKVQGLSLERARQRSVLLAFPVYDRPHHQHEAAAMETVGLLSRLGIRHGFIHAHGQPIHTARNMLTKAFLDSAFTDLLFIDADMRWAPWDVARLLAQRHPFIGGVGRKRNDTPVTDRKAWCFGPLDDQPAHDAAGAFEVRHVGTGFLLVNRLVFEAIEQYAAPQRVKDSESIEYTRFFKWGFEDGSEIGEDYGFCHDYRAIGGNVMVDPSIELSHFGVSEHKARLISLIA